MSKVFIPPPRFVRLFIVQDLANDIRLSTAELGNWTGKLTHLLRVRAVKRDYVTPPEFRQPGVYLLFGKVHRRPAVYVGEGEVIIDRVQEQLSQKFWREAIIFTGKDKYVNKASIKYLENTLYRRLTDAGHYTIVNKNVPTCPDISAAEQSELDVAHDNICFLTPKLTRHYL